MNKNSVTDFEELEEGEIECDSSFEELYTPLERPSYNAPVTSKVVIESDVDDNDPSSADSDSSDGGGGRQKIKKSSKPSVPIREKPKKNNLNIWCNVLQAESVSTNLTDCNLDEFQRKIRGLEPYAPRGFNSFKNDGVYEEKNINSLKRNHSGSVISDRKFVKHIDTDPKRGTPKDIPPLCNTVWESDEKLAKEIAMKLSEVKHELILNAISIAGKDMIIPVFEETRKIEKAGGMLIMNGSRRRTSGGVFFYLLKTSEDIPQEQLKEIFQGDKNDASVQKKKVARQLRRQQAAKLKETLMKAGDIKTA